MIFENALLSSILPQLPSIFEFLFYIKTNAVILHFKKTIQLKLQKTECQLNRIF